MTRCETVEERGADTTEAEGAARREKAAHMPQVPRRMEYPVAENAFLSLA